MITEVFFGNTFFAVLLLQSTICVALGLAGSLMLRHRAARAHQVLLLGMLAAMLIPPLYALVSHYELGIFTANSERSVTEPFSAYAVANYETSWIPAIEDAGHSADAGDNYVLATTTERAESGFAWRSVLIWAWIAVSALLVCRLVMTFLLGARLLQKAEPVSCERIREAAEVARQKLGISRPCQIYASERVRSPVIWCWATKPILLIPSDAEHLNDSADWVGMFCHELAHWKRSDHVSGLLAELILCVFPWHPLMWWAKRRLVELSEQACDDWVVASGQPGTEYAESLLDLAPEGQLAFLPTVVGKEKHMEQRIQRIVKHRCGNPRIGIRWAVAVSTIAACIAVTVAFAQERPARFDRPRDQIPRERVAEREEAQLPSPELMEQQRLELAEKLRQLEERAHDIEQKLEGLPEDESEQAELFQAELREIRERMQVTMQEIEERERERPRFERRGTQELDVRRRELLQHRRALQRRAGEIEHQLGQLRDDQDEEARQLQAERREIRQQIRGIENELRGAERGRREPRDRERPAPEARRRELIQQRRELQERARHLERELRDASDPEAARNLETELDAVHRQIRDIEQAVRDVDRPRREPAERRPEADEHRRELMRQRDELIEQGHQIKRQLGEAPDREEANNLRDQWEAIQEQIEVIERQLQRREPEPEPREIPRMEALDKLIQLLKEQDRHDEAEEVQREVREIMRRRQERPEPRPEGLERQVHELRTEVQGLRREMAELRELLQQLLQRPRAEPEPRAERERRRDAEPREREGRR